jgi:hypothetical protein
MSQGTVRAILGLAAGVWFAAATPGVALTANPGDVLEVPFSLTGPAAGANTLTFHLVNVTAVGVSTMTVELYDGATLLASLSSVAVNGIVGFVDAGSLWTTNAVSTDLASVRAGTIDGRVRVLPDFSGAGAFSADVSSITSFAVGIGTDVATITPIAGVLLVGTPRLVPEPEAAALLTAAAALCGFRRRR